ncbi:MAG TPA: glycosyltransferase family 39 protein [Candidatus Sulfomarinibacteraceae bacterium]|nr:glycosyltransferase family 39 protein [Candidatus Sulfomarinibacteraceae bacterium]
MTLKFSHTRWLVVILLLALFLRVANLGGKSFWLDEAFSVTRASPSLERVDSNNPPLYYTSLYYWTEAFGADEATARLPSALISTVNVALLYLLARQLFTREVALLAAGLLAVSPLNLWYAQEARLYTSIVFVALLMSLGLAWRPWAGFLLYFVGLSVGLYVGYLVFPLWVGISVLWLVLWWQRDRGPLAPLLWVAASGAAWWLYRPWLPHFEAWLQGSLLRHWMFEPVRTLLGLEAFATWHFLLALVLAAAGLLALTVAGPAVLRQQRWRLAITLPALVGFVVVVLTMLVPRLYGLKRVLVTGWPFVILALAWLVWQMERWRRPALSTLLGLSLVVSLATLFLAPKDDWRSASAYLQRQLDENDVVWVDPRWNTIPLEYYGLVAQVESESTAELPELAATHDEIWIVAERFPGDPVPSSPSERWLNANWQLMETESFYRLEVRRYAPEMTGAAGP